jgi:hypothetical protein
MMIDYDRKSEESPDSQEYIGTHELTITGPEREGTSNGEPSL